MTDQDLLQRKSSEINVVAGKPVINGTRMSVDFILNLLAYGASFDEIIEEYQGISTQDIQACLLFASRSIASSEFMPLSTEPA